MSIRKTIELITNSSGRYITPSGLSIVGNMLSRSEFVQYCNQRRDLPKRSEPQIPNGDIMLTMIGLLVQGKPQFDSVNEMKSDPEYYRAALGLKRGVPSPETLRQRLDAIGKALRKAIQSANVKLFTVHGVMPSAIAKGLIPLDTDCRPAECFFSPATLMVDALTNVYKKQIEFHGFRIIARMKTCFHTTRTVTSVFEDMDRF